MRRPGRYLAVTIVLGIPAIVVTSVAEARFDLSAGATFALLMALSLVAAIAAFRLVEGSLLGPRRRRDDR
jgi:uncharacterized protein (DUF983 family)